MFLQLSDCAYLAQVFLNSFDKFLGVSQNSARVCLGEIGRVCIVSILAFAVCFDVDRTIFGFDESRFNQVLIESGFNPRMFLAPVSLCQDCRARDGKDRIVRAADGLTVSPAREDSVRPTEVFFAFLKADADDDFGVLVHKSTPSVMRS